MESTHGGPAKAGPRLLHLDLARYWALLGIVYVHTQGGQEANLSAPERALYVFGNGVCPALFALLMGYTLVYGASKRTSATEHFLVTLVRASVLIFVGLILGPLDSGIAIILVNLGALAIVGYPLLRLSLRVLTGLTLGGFVLVPQASYWVRGTFELTPHYDNFSLLWADSVPGFLSALFLTGYYPLVNWLCYFALGIVVARIPRLTRSHAIGLTVAGGGGAILAKLASAYFLHGKEGLASLAAQEGRTEAQFLQTHSLGLYGTVPPDNAYWLGVDFPHSGTSFDLIYTAGLAVALLGMAFLVSMGIAAHPRAGRGLTLLTYGGAMALSLYTLHVLMKTSVPLIGAVPDEALVHWAILTLVGILFGVLGRRGPLEWVHARIALSLATPTASRRSE